MLAVAGSRSRGSRTISVRPPLSSVISRSADDVHAIVGGAAHDPRRRHRRPSDLGIGNGQPPRGRPPPPESGTESASAAGRMTGGAAALRTSARPGRRCRPHRPALRSREPSAALRRRSTRLLVSLPSEMMHDRLLAVLPALRHRHGFSHRVVHRRAAVRVHAGEAAADARCDRWSSRCTRSGSALKR